jgi:hypothetical protein
MLTDVPRPHFADLDALLSCLLAEESAAAEGEEVNRTPDGDRDHCNTWRQMRRGVAAEGKSHGHG